PLSPYPFCEPSATATSPSTLSLHDALPISSVSEYVTVPPWTSLEDAVIPTAVPLVTSSATVLASAVLASVGCDGATSLTAMVKSSEEHTTELQLPYDFVF